MNLLILEDTYPHKALEAAEILKEKHALDVEVTEFPARILQSIKEAPPDHLLLDMMVPAEPDPKAEINVLLKDYIRELDKMRAAGSRIYGEALAHYPRGIIAPDFAFDLTIQLLEAGTSAPLVRYAMRVCTENWDPSKRKKNDLDSSLHDRPVIRLAKLLEAAERIPLPYGGPLALMAFKAGLNVGTISDTHVHETLFQKVYAPQAMSREITWMSILFVSLPLVAQGLFTIPEVIEGGARGHFFGPQRFPGEVSLMRESFKAKVENWVLAAETLIGRKNNNLANSTIAG